MKRTATLLLIFMALLFVLAKTMEPQAAYWGYISAFAEAGTIGAIADWFAVVALFRHPLGIPIPHTAIIPANRDRIAERLAEFLCLKFLDTEQIAKYLGLGDPIKLAARWLSQPTNARKTAAQICKSIEHILPLLQSQRLKDYLQASALRTFKHIDLSHTSKDILTLIVQNDKHQVILDTAVTQIGKLLTDESVRTEIANAVASEVKYLRYIGLDAAAGRYATRKLVTTIAHIMEEMAQDPNHPFRNRFNQYIHRLINELDSNEIRKNQLRQLQQQILNRPEISNALDNLWTQTLEWIKKDCQKTTPATQNHLEQALQTIGHQIQNDETIRLWLNEKIFTIIPQWVARYRKTIHRYIVNTVKAWTPEEMSSGLEKYIGRDLQFIRINGTLVGGLAGLAIYTTIQIISRIN